MPPRLSVAVAEDHALFRRQLVVALERDPDLDVVAEADDVARLVPRLLSRPAVVVVDASVPTGDLVRAFWRAATVGPPVVAMLGPTDDPLAPLQAGAAGAVAKGSLLDRGAELLRLAAAGVPVVDAEVARTMLDAARAWGLALDPRQAEVLDGLAAGRDLVGPARWQGQATADTAEAVAAAIMGLRHASAGGRRPPAGAVPPVGRPAPIPPLDLDPE